MEKDESISEDELARIREQMRKSAEEVREETPSLSGSQAPSVRGACYLSRPHARECFNDFTVDMCTRAAAQCGCIAQFVPGQRCPQTR